MDWTSEGIRGKSVIKYGKLKLLPHIYRELCYPAVFYFILQNHTKSCEYREVQCAQCGQQLELIKHEETDCPMRLMPCPYCRTDVPSEQMQVGLYT